MSIGDYRKQHQLTCRQLEHALCPDLRPKPRIDVLSREGAEDPSLEFHCLEPRGPLQNAITVACPSFPSKAQKELLDRIICNHVRNFKQATGALSRARKMQ
jgi:hypothetical protein